MNDFIKRMLGLSEDGAAPASEFQPLESEQDWERLLARSAGEPVVVFKHSVTCGISAGARRRMLGMNEPGDPPVYELVIQSARPLSNTIAQALHVRHESPQAIVLRDGNVIFHTSHGSITPERIRAAIHSAEPL